MSTNQSPKQWYKESISANEQHCHVIAEKYSEKTTDFQKMEMVRLQQFGKALILDGKVQSSEKDEFIYHEALVQPGMVAMDKPKRAFVVGGGEGATLREIFRHPSIEKAVMVDIDRDVVDGCIEHLDTFHQGAFEDPRCELIINDAKAYVENCKEKFDFIIIDISEALEGTTAAFMFTQEFYQQLSDMLTDDGKVVIQSGSLSIMEYTFFMRVHQTLKTVFPTVIPYGAFVPVYAAFWGFNLASKSPSSLPSAVEVDQRLAKLGIDKDLKFYDGTAHQGILSLPKYLRTQLNKEWNIYSAADKPAIYRPEEGSTRS